MHLLARDHITRAHGILLAFAIHAPAFSHPYAAQRRMREAAMIFGIPEISGWIPRLIICAQAQVLVDTIWINNLAWVHLPVWVPDRLELAEGLDQFRSKHLVKEFSLGLTI